MAIDTPITIDLRKYGLDSGEVVMGMPPSSKLIMFKNRATQLLTKFGPNNTIVPDLSNAMTYRLEELMLYVRSAPFSTVDGLLDTLDRIDERIGNGRGMELVDEMTEAKAKIADGDTSPSPSSPEAESENLG